MHRLHRVVDAIEHQPVAVQLRGRELRSRARDPLAQARKRLDRVDELHTGQDIWRGFDAEAKLGLGAAAYQVGGECRWHWFLV
ncbi:hypothetical protein SE17_13950 [Kouleothrix aurantiaca]|uniref:Uncharacterized protein n=1 Tax=Kouleothrix aurantiaca TaxID=186479 RepID=A0A0P9HDL6_9CHLR|nr:hypothetical protein SE17_13950 [Kouleothrix aurantiaca]